MTKLTPATKATYLAMVKALPNVKLFQKLYMTDETGKQVEITNDGELSCAFTVTSILKIFNLIDDVHATVAGTLRAAPNNGWEPTTTPQAGDLIVWDVYEGHPHIGFYLGGQDCISNNTALGYPTKHKITMKDGRQPQQFLTNPNFI